MYVIISAAIFFAGICIFALCSGAMIFRAVFARKENSSASFKRGIPGIDPKFTAHTNDAKIMDIIHRAKQRWTHTRGEPVSVFSRESLELRGYLCTETDSSVFALLMHGYCDSAAGTAYLAEAYASYGIGVLAVDCRAHGESGGTYAGMGYKDARDLVVWIDFLKARFGNSVKIILHGISMGAAAVYIYGGLKSAAKRGQFANVLCMVCDCGFSNYAEQMHRRLSAVLPGKKQAAVRTLILSGASVMCALINGFFFFQNNPLKAAAKRSKIGSSSIPLLIFQGTEDVLIPLKTAEKIYEAAAGKKRLITVSGAPHIGSYFYDSEGYFNAILEESGLKKIKGSLKEEENTTLL